MDEAHKRFARSDSDSGSDSDEVSVCFYSLQSNIQLTEMSFTAKCLRSSSAVDLTPFFPLIFFKTITTTATTTTVAGATTTLSQQQQLLQLILALIEQLQG